MNYANLVVGGVPVVCADLAELFRRNGYEVHTCIYNEQVLDLVGRLRPEVLLLDIEMSELSGLEITEELKRQPALRPRKVIAVVGRCEPDLGARLHAGGFDHHLVKPVNWNDLKALLP
jgi:two-component system, OmpR family, response regulator